MPDSPRFENLDAIRVAETIDSLERRIGERFPEASLRGVARKLHRVARESIERIEWMESPILWVRLLAGGLLVGSASVLVPIKWLHFKELSSFGQYISLVEPTLGALFFLGAIVVFLVTLEIRIKRARALAVIHELRALAHIVDMHQLTKDPEKLLLDAPRTESSPEREMTPFELGRYLDYCSELLALISKVGALYVQGFTDSVAINAVDEVERLTSSLSNKVWQKIMILENQQE